MNYSNYLSAGARQLWILSYSPKKRSTVCCYSPHT